MDYLVKVRGVDFVTAVEAVMGKAVEIPSFVLPEKKKNDGKLYMPHYAFSLGRAREYLLSRGIDEGIIDECVAKNMIAENVKTGAVMFLGYPQFIGTFQALGYTLEWRGKYLRIRPDRSSKFFRMDKLGKGYTYEDVQERLRENARSRRIIPYIPYKPREKPKGLYALYLHYCYLLGELPKQRPSNREACAVIKEDVKRARKYNEEAKLLGKYNIYTAEELSLFTEGISKKFKALAYDRAKLRHKLRRMHDMELLRAGDIDEENEAAGSVLDELFAILAVDKPGHIALKYYKAYRSGSAKTLKSIQITLAARLEKFNLESLAALTSTDELDLQTLGEKKVALFAIIPDNDTSFNFLVSILYTQLFQQLFFAADHKYGGALPVHVHFLMDEFANISLPDDFDKILSVMRSRGVSVSIILQNLAQLKALFEKQWESIVGNCEEFVYLGGNEQSTHKYVSELLGKETIDTNS